MPLTINLDVNNPAPTLQGKNTNTSLAITTGNDTITVNANVNFPRILVFRPTVAASMTVGLASGVKFPIDAGAAMHLEITGTTVFQVSSDAVSGTMHIWVVQ